MSEERRGQQAGAGSAADPSGRRDVRVETRLAVRYRLEGFDGFVERYSANISYNGIFIVTREPKPLGSEVAFEIQLDDGQPALSGWGLVRWIRPDTGNVAQPPGLGLQFTRLDEANRARVRAIVDRYLAAKAAGLEPQAPHTDELLDAAPRAPEAQPPLPWQEHRAQPAPAEQSPGVARPRSAQRSAFVRHWPVWTAVALAVLALVAAWIWRGALAP